jgi:hypothetical protein
MNRMCQGYSILQLLQLASNHFITESSISAQKSMVQITGLSRPESQNCIPKSDLALGVGKICSHRSTCILHKGGLLICHIPEARPVIFLKKTRGRYKSWMRLAIARAINYTLDRTPK